MCDVTGDKASLTAIYRNWENTTLNQLSMLMGVSYLITIYNKAPYIPYMLEGLAAQMGDFEKQYIFINDGSTDESMTIVRESTRDWPNTVYIDQHNQGPAIATNRAAEHAIYPYLKMLDADDVLAPYATSLCLKAIEQSQSAAVYSLPLNFEMGIDYSQGIEFPQEPENLTLITPDDSLFYVLKTGMAGSSTLMVRRDAFVRVGGCDEQVFVQDFSLPIRLAQYYTISFFREPIVYFTKEAEGRVLGNPAQVLHDLTASQHNFIKAHPRLPNRYKKIAAKRCMGRAWKWAQRMHNAPVGSKYFWLYAANRLKLPLSPAWQLQQAQQVFYKHHQIR